MATEVKASCACGARSENGSHASVVDPEIKHAIGTRLRRIEGQVRGLQKMIEEERYCADVLMQLSSVQEALRGVSRELLHNHLKHCVGGASTEDPARADEMYDEFMDLIYRSLR
ncbi:MAG TPA: metal-sensitive transcriptional regulator [Gemmatimonadales bacterium]|nr:metal-sensitive transcriptional regulator [Gemmatimonadales bacterium]